MHSHLRGIVVPPVLRPHRLLAVSLLAAACAVADQTGPGGDISSLLILPDSVVIAAGQSVQFQAMGQSADGRTRPVQAQWSASGGTITGDGLYTADSTPGTYQVTATLDQSKLKAQARVHNHGSLKDIVLTPDSTAVSAGAQTRFSAYGQTANGSTVTVSVAYSATGGTISSDGLYTAGSAGGTYRVIAVQSGGTLADTSEIVVAGGTATVAAVSVSPGTASVPVGSSAQFQAVVKDATGTVLTGQTVTWTSSDATIASVDGTGIVTGLAQGSATISATCQGKSGTASVTITASSPPPPPPTGGCPGIWPSAVYPAMPLSTGQAFYVSSSTGSDANPGTIDQPWQTLQKAFDALQPGQIAYLRGGIYGAFCSASRFSRAGTAAAPITVQGYPGERAVLHGQIRLEGSYFRLSSVVVEGPSCGTWGATTQQGDNLVLMVPGTTHHVEVSNSEIYHSGWHAGIAAGGDDIWILNNYIHDNGGFNDTSQTNTSHGIYYHAGTRGVVANNILEHNVAKGLSARFTANHILVINNTVVGNGRSGLDIADSTHDWLFANNILVNNGNVNGGNGINTSGSIGGTTNVEINNVFWNNGTSGTDNWSGSATVVNNLVADPLLVNPVSSQPSTTHQGYTNDYHLGSGSPAIDFASATYALPYDLAGVCRPRGAGPDAGVYEQ